MPFLGIIPQGFDRIGIVDGQHRVFCYHEGKDRNESKIQVLRKRQNLLVTGIIYPENISEIQRRTFEAKLFLEINDNQKRVQSALKQDIEVIVRPYSGMAVAKRVIQQLSKRGPYAGMLQTHYFDAPSKIKTSSIVSYGLRPLVKLDGQDSLFFAWSDERKEKLRDAKGDEQLQLLEEYVFYCTDKLNEFLLAFKLVSIEAGCKWDIDADIENRSPLISLTVINGLIACLRKVIANKLELSIESHKNRLKDISSFKFSDYKSSHWQKLGIDLFENYYDSKTAG